MHTHSEIIIEYIGLSCQVARYYHQKFERRCVNFYGNADATYVCSYLGMQAYMEEYKTHAYLSVFISIM